jgi:hypothetical protein
MGIILDPVNGEWILFPKVKRFHVVYLIRLEKDRFIQGFKHFL